MIKMVSKLAIVTLIAGICVCAVPFVVLAIIVAAIANPKASGETISHILESCADTVKSMFSNALK